MSLNLLSPALVLCFMVAAPVTASEHLITQKDRTFSQTEITVHPGDILAFKNSDDITHNVFSVSEGMEFEIRHQAPGQTSAVPFPREGIAEVRCSIHPKMKLIVTVRK